MGLSDAAATGGHGGARPVEARGGMDQHWPLACRSRHGTTIAMSEKRGPPGLGCSMSLVVVEVQVPLWRYLGER